MSEPLKDLRGVEYREVNHFDSVIITGAEYLRKASAIHALQAECDIYREALKRIVEEDHHGEATDAAVDALAAGEKWR